MMQNSLSSSPDSKMNALFEAFEGNPEIAEKFVKVFLSEDLEENLGGFFKNEKCKEIVGEEIAEKMLSLYS